MMMISVCDAASVCANAAPVYKITALFAATSGKPKPGQFRAGFRRGQLPLASL
jgi:hypothetical protein